MTAKKAVRRPTSTILSPLRYPGAKRRLWAYIAQALHINGLRPKLFVEPFAGGASVSLQLLQLGVVERIALGERDPLVAAFWAAVFDSRDSTWLCERVRRAKVTLEVWKRERASAAGTRRDRAFKCLFLNRTNFSGILSKTAGPIGGQAQTSGYDIGCRFPKTTLVKRIRQATALSSSVEFVLQGDWKDTLKRIASLGYEKNEVFFYFDPPFFEKADRLYRHYFDLNAHLELRDALVKLDSPWLLSYDPAKEIIKAYESASVERRRVQLPYSVAQGDPQVMARELIVSSLPKLPSATRLWMSNDERKEPGADSPAWWRERQRAAAN